MDEQRPAQVGFTASSADRTPQVSLPPSAASARMLSITTPRSSWTLPGRQAPLAHVPQQAFRAGEV